MMTLYERFGGKVALDTAVEIFYEKVLDDDRVNYFFDGVDMSRQIAKQKAFLTMAYGGSHHYTGKNLREGHKHLLKKGLNDTHVDIIIEHLESTLLGLGASEEDTKKAIVIVDDLRDDVLGR